MALTPQQLYEECEGTLIPANDPSGAGSQANTYTYTAGNGSSLRDKLDKLNEAQSVDSVPPSPRPIDVDVRPPSATVPGPGKITGSIFAQALKQSIDLDEDAAMMLADGQGAITATDREKWITAKAAYFDMPTDTSFVVTDEMQTQLLDAVPPAHMPNTRANLIAALSRPGSRAQEMTGEVFTMDQMLTAEQWRIANKPASPSLYD